MDRRGFLTGVGTLGATAAGGWVAVNDAGGARAEGLARAAGASTAETKAAPAASPAVTLGYLRGSAGLLQHAARGWEFPERVGQMRWTAWDPSLALPILDDRVDISIGSLRRAPAEAPSPLLAMEVVAHFAIDEAPHFAPFNAWRYVAAPGKPVRWTTPLTFEAGMPDRVALQVHYALDRARVSERYAAGGQVYLPVGGRNGAGTGIYVLAAPSQVTGEPPDLGAYTFTGDLLQPLRRDDGAAADFDFVTLTIAPVVA